MTGKKTVGDWQIGGSSEVFDDVIMLVPPMQFRQGCAWAQTELPEGNWGMNATLNVSELGSGPIGFGLWFVHDYGMHGPLNGGPARFRGISILFFTEMNHSLSVEIIESENMHHEWTQEHPKSVWNLDESPGFRVGLEFQKKEVLVYLNSTLVARKWTAIDLRGRWMGITAATAKFVGRIDLHEIELDVGRPSLTKRPINPLRLSPKIESDSTVLRSPKFNATLMELMLRYSQTGSITRESNVSDVLAVIDEINAAEFEVASFLELNEFVSDKLLRFTQKWQSRSTSIVRKVENARNISGVAWNYTQSMLRTFNESIMDSMDKTSTKIVDLAQVMLDLAEEGIDDGRLGMVVDEVNWSNVMNVIWFVGGCELVAFMVFFLVAQMECCQEKLRKFGKLI
jgi:hypothetical protein